MKEYKNNYIKNKSKLTEVFDSKTIKALQFSVLKEFKRFCEENNLKYFLSYGTLIGAVRHQGFIPWDDDIDVQMFRSDYDKFISLYKSNSFYTLENKTDKNYPYPFMKFCSKNTLCIEDGFKKYFNMGMNIDVFPIDYLSKDSKEKDKQIKKVKKLIKLNHFKHAVDSPSTLIKSNFLTTTVLTILKPFVYPFSYALINSRINKIASLGNKNKSTLVAGLNWGIGYKLIVESKEYQEIVNRQFESEFFSCPKGSDNILNVQYNDYMKLPEKDKQKPHHDFKCYLIEN